MESFFKKLVLVTALLTVVIYVIPYVDYRWLSHNQIALLDKSGFDAVIPINELLYWLTCIIWLAVSVGLYFYVKVAKPIFFILCAASLMSTLLYGIQVITAFENLIFGLLNLADGAIVAMLLFTSVGTKFSRNS